MPKTRRLVVALLAAGVPLSACSGGGGGATSCGDYRSSGSADKASAVTQMLHERGEQVTPAAVDLARASVAAYCFLNSADNRIDSIYHG